MLTFALLQSSGVEEITPSTYLDQLSSQVTACGVRTDQFSIQYSGELQSDEVQIADLSNDTEVQLYTCLAAIMRGGAIINFANEEDNRRFFEAYRAAYAEIDGAAMRASAQRWLSERDLFDSRPHYDPVRQSLAQFAEQIEQFCSLPSGALIPNGSDRLVWMPGGLPREPLNAESINGILCLMSLTALDDQLNDMIGGLGFVGNSAGAVVEE